MASSGIANGRLYSKMSPESKRSKSSGVTVIIGTQWGDEGKGKVVDLIAKDMDIVCRGQGGSNAGHTVVLGEKKFFFHLIPSGITNHLCKVVIGNGVVVHLPTLMKEIETNTANGLKDMEKRIILSDRAHLVFDMHQEVDGLLEKMRGSQSIGTTKRGIGPTYSTKALRNSIRVCDLVGDFDVFTEKFKALVTYHQRLFPELVVNIDQELEKYKMYAVTIRPMVQDSVVFLHASLQSGKRILVEGANGVMLDVDFGTYPFVTSSNTVGSGACTGVGIPPRDVGEVYGVVKAYTTRVGAGILPTELTDETGNHLQNVGHEFGTTTGRPRRCGWLDLVVVRYSHMLNGYTALAVTKLDVLDDLEELKIGVAYKHRGKNLPSFPANMDLLSEIQVEYITMPGWKTSIKDVRTFSELPENAQKYIKKIEEIMRIPVRWIGVGQSRDAMILV